MPLLSCRHCAWVALTFLCLQSRLWAQTPAYVEVYGGPATCLTNRAPKSFGLPDYSNLGFAVGGRWHLKPKVYLVGELSLMQDQPLLHQTARERILAIRELFTPTLGLGRVASSGRWAMYLSAHLGVRVVAGEGIRTTSGGAWLRGAFPTNLGVFEPQSYLARSEGSPTTALPTWQIGTGFTYLLKGKVRVFADVRLGRDLTDYDPNTTVQITYYDPAALPQWVPQYTSETRYGRGSVSRLYGYIQGGLSIRLGRKAKPDTYVQ